MEENNTCSGEFDRLAISNCNDFSNQLLRGIVLSTFECGEVAAVIFRKYQCPLYVVPRKLLNDISIVVAKLKCGDEVAFEADGDDIVSHIEEGTGGAYYSNFVAGGMVIAVVILSKEQPRQVWTADFGMLSIDEKVQDCVEVAAPNVPLNAYLGWKIDYGVKTPSDFKLLSFKPTISFSLLELCFVNVGRLDYVSRAPWNADLKPASFKQQNKHLDEDEEDVGFGVPMFSNCSIVENKIPCFVISSTRMYCPIWNEYVLIALPKENDGIHIGTSVLADVFRCGWNCSLIAVQIKSMERVEIIQSPNKSVMFLLKVVGLLYGLYQTVSVGLVSDPLCKLQRLVISKPVSVWVKHSNDPKIYPAFSVVELLDKENIEALIAFEISSSGFVRDESGTVHVPNYPLLTFQLAVDLLEKFAVGQFIKFTAEFDNEMDFFWILSAELDLQPTRLIIGKVELTKDISTFTFRASFALTAGPLLQNASLGFVEDKHEQLKATSLSSAQFWVVFKRSASSVVPLRLLPPKKVRGVKKLETAMRCSLSIFEKKYQAYQVPEKAFTPEMYEEMDLFLDGVPAS